jgi:hypothetical protein
LAKSGLKHIDVGAELTKTEWESEDSHELLHGSSFPGTPVERQLFYRDDEHKWYIYNASSWVWLGGGGGGMADHGNEYHTPDFAEATHGHAQLHTQGMDTALGALGTKNPPIDADKALYRDSESSDALTTSTWSQIKAFFKTYFDTLYSTVSHTHAQLHDRLHAITSTSDHSSSATSGRILKADANGLPVNATNTDTDVADAVTKKHAQLCEAADFTKLDGIEAGADVTATHAPQAHKASHQDAGSDEISLAGLDGEPSTLATHKNLATGIHGVGGSTVESVSGSQAKVDAHKDLATGVHGVGAGTIAKTSDIPSKVIDLTFIIDGGGSAITTGQKGHIEIPFACTITGWTLLADQSGSIVIDVWKDTYANFPPTVADTITGTEKPTLSSVQKNQDLTLTTWTTAVSAGDILAFNVDSVATVTRATLGIRAQKS